MIKLIKKIIRKIKDKYVKTKRHLFLFKIPNYQFIKNEQLKFGTAPNCQQKIILSGEGQIKMGVNCVLGYKLGGFNYGGSIEIQPRGKESQIIFGNNVLTNNNIFVCSMNKIQIGDNTLIGQYVTIMDHDAHGLPPNKRLELGDIGEIMIGKNVWIGNNVIILKNTFVGENSIIAAGAVVSGVFPDNVIIGGVPAKILKDLPQK